MPKKETTLKPAVREACNQIKSLRDAKGLRWQWSQQESMAAIAFAARDFEWGKDGDVKEFISLGEHGFLANASQFRQALEALPDADALKLAPSAAPEFLYS